MKNEFRARLRNEIRVLMACLSVEEIIRNHALVKQIEFVMSELNAAEVYG